ncbi:MAG TPA: phosphopyruvate hydratase [Alphaproteobacteria bacterium]
MSKAAIASVRGRRVWDSRGRPTVEAEIRLAEGAIGRAIAPAGASTGSGEALDLRDGGTAFGGLGVGRAVAAVNEVIAPALAGLDAAEQHALDAKLIALDGTPDKSRLGGNAIVAVSMAAAHAAAASRGVPLWKHFLGASEPVVPLPEVQIFGGGAHAAARIDLQDVMVMPLGARNFSQALEWTAEVYRAVGARLAAKGKLQGVADEGGYWPAVDANEEVLAETVAAIAAAGFKPGRDLALSLDIAATQLRRDARYHLKRDGKVLDSDAMIRLMLDWLDRYPIASIEDPLAEDDEAGLVAFTKEAGKRVQIIGDDFLVTNAARVKNAAARGACNAVLVKPNQAGTLTEAKAALDAGKAAGWGTIVSARSGETEDVTIAHLAVGWHAGQLKVGSFARSERMAKWNEVLRIEEALGPTARFAGRVALPVKP